MAACRAISAVFACFLFAMVMTYFNTTDSTDLSTPEKALEAYIDATNSHVFENVARILAEPEFFGFKIRSTAVLNRQGYILRERGKAYMMKSIE